MKLLFATNNKHKLEEISALMPEKIELISLHQAGITGDIPETGSTLVENAIIKAEYGYKKTGLWCFADDTGLEVDALNGAPGVYSARYAGEGKNSHENVQLLLKNLQGIENRAARFKTVIALIYNGKTFLFEGVVNGRITDTPGGDGGFGYDPIFIPDGFNQTFAQMPLVEKNTISHRAKAVEQLIDFLKGV